MMAQFDLSTREEYQLTPSKSDGCCLIHVKLTESCAKAIDSLITSNKGAFFSLWFSQNGGHLSMASTKNDGIVTFQFSTARLNKADTHGRLECIHQQLDINRSLVTSCMGLVEHKLTVKATDEVYEKTKERATQLEKERQEVRAKEINLPKVANKVKHISNSNSGIGSRSKLTSKPSFAGGGGGVNNQHHSSVLGRTQKTLKERVMYLLALKSIRRPEIVLKLKKATKRGANSLTNLDSVLSEVSDIHDGSVHHLKPSLYAELDVDNWPFYNEAERGLVKRKLQTVYRQPVVTTASETTTSTVEHDNTTTSSNTSSNIVGIKRIHDPSHDQFVSKKSKLCLPTSSSSSSVSNSTVHDNRIDHHINKNKSTEQQYHGQSNESSTAANSSGVHSKTITESNFDSASLVSSTDSVHPYVNESTTTRKEIEKMDTGGHKQKKKKKHKHGGIQQEERGHVSNETHSKSDSSSRHHQSVAESTQQMETIDGPTFGSYSLDDFISQFPAITSLEQRAKYKQFFAQKYDEYLALKETIDKAHKELITLSSKLESLPQNSTDIKELKTKVKEKFRTLQQDPDYLEKKSLLLNLHYKLDHLKKMVVQYDSSHLRM